ncbi:MAG: hypothetical protein LBH18_07845, partial [Spirochaetaceae bacterium]|nr:hypothetical protein [Spirochaetaceae bacterium]
MNKLRLLLSITALTAFIAGCGELDMALSSSKVYKVNAMINGLSLDECSILSNNSEISPYFDFNIRSDPDIVALGVYLKDAKGKETGLRVIYALPGHNPANWTEEETANTDTAKTPENQTEEQPTPENGGDTPAGELPETPSEPESSAGLTAETPTEDNRELPADDGEKQAGDTPENTGFNGENDNTVPETTAENNENTAVPSDYETNRPPSSRYTSGTETITVEDFYSELPMLILGSNLPAGFYTIVFDVISSNGTVLNSVEKPFYYIAGEKLKIENIISHLPGVSTTARIVPPGEKVLLEAVVQAGAGLNPYIIWYNGKEKIGEGFASDGADYIFWTSPSQNGFQNIRLEVFPFDPSKHYPVMRGISRSISLPVSQRHGRDGYYAGSEIQLSRWYQLWGNLKDARDPANNAMKLVKSEDADICWQPAAGSYGLVINAKDSYKLPGEFFKYIQKNEGSGELLFRFLPVPGADGSPLLTAILYDADYKTSCTVLISLTGEAVALNVVYKDETLKAETPLIFDEDGFVSAALDFQFFEESITVSLGVETPEAKSIETWNSVPLDFIAGGKGYIQFGGADNALVADNTPLNMTAVLTEIATLYPAVSPAFTPVEEEKTE